MKNNCIIIPLEKTYKFNQRQNPNSPKSTTNRALKTHISFDVHSNFYQQNDYIQTNNKNSSNNLVIKRNDLHPIIANRGYKKDDYEIQAYKTEKYPESESYQENMNSSSYKPYYSNKKFFNGQQNRLVIKKNNDNIENIDKNRPNYSYYESKYTKKTNDEKDNYYSIKAKTNDIKNKNIYQNENCDTLNISSTNNIKKFRRIDSNFCVKYEPEKSTSKKGQEIFDNKIQNDLLQNLVKSNDKNITKNRAIAINNKNSNNKFYYQNSSSKHLDTLKNTFNSPVKRIRIEKNFYQCGDNSNNKNDKSLPSKSIDKKENHNVENSNVTKNKKIEIIKANITERKKPSNFALKKIPFSSKDKKINDPLINKMQNQNKYLKLDLSNVKENINRIKNIYSYTSLKSQDNRNKQSENKEIAENNLSLIKKMKLNDSKTFKKSTSSDIDKTFNYKKFERENILNLNKNNNISNNAGSRETINENKNLVLNRIKKGKNGIIDNDNEKNPNKFFRRLHSQQQLIIINKEAIDGKSNNGINKIKVMRNNLVNSGLMENNQRYTNEITLNKNNNYENNSLKTHSSKNIPIIKSNIFSKSHNYNNSAEIKDEKRKNCNIIHSITISKINPAFLENNHHSSNNLIKNNLTNIMKSPQIQKNRYLSNLPKYQSRATYQNVKNENDEENWEDNEYMGLKKKTFDPGRRKIKIKHKSDASDLIKNTFVPSELFSQPIFIKACESLTVTGKKENGNKKINQDSYLIERNINGILNFNIFGVLDGHGEDGHYASQFVSRYIITHLKNHPLLKKCEDAKEVYEKLILNGYEIIANIFVEADTQIQKEKFDYKNSGTTCVLVIQIEEKIICANAGDSRAIIVYDKCKDDSLLESKIYNLSYDCKPELPNEKKRIYECGGSVEKALDENDQPAGPYRVWANGEDYPGLAMSRSIGDMDAKKIGVIPNPQIVEYSIDYDTKYMLICSDGIWEFISNNDAMIMGNKYYLRNDAAGLCRELYKKSIEFWFKEDIVVDDITAIAVFF